MIFKSEQYYTFLGFLAIIIWGTSAVFTRNLSVNIGAYTAAALVNLIGALVVIIRQLIKKEELSNWRDVPRRYWIFCGLLFVIYTVTAYVSMSVVKTDEIVVVMVLIRFLWPLFTLVSTIPILKAKASPWLICSVFVCMAGIIIARLETGAFHLSYFFGRNLSGSDIVGYILSFIVAISWGIYTNLTRKYAANKNVDGVGVFMLATAVILGGVAFFVDEPRRFSINMTSQILYASIIVGAVANLFWNLSVKKGNMLLVVLIANFLPVISTVSTSLLLGVKITLPVIIGSLLVAIGTIWSKACFNTKEKSVNAIKS